MYVVVHNQGRRPPDSEEDDGDFMLLAGDPQAPAQHSDTSHMFEDTGAGREAFPRVDRKLMMEACNTRPGRMTAEIDGHMPI